MSSASRVKSMPLPAPSAEIMEEPDVVMSRITAVCAEV
jgi:hypothetical protein